MSSSIGNATTGASFQAARRQPSDEDILKKIEKDFGKDGVKSVTDDEGKLDKTKLEEFLKSKGVQPPQGKPPGGAGGQAGDAAGQGDASGGSQQAGSSSESTGSSSEGSSTEVKSETRQTNSDGSVTTTIKYADGSVKKTTTQPDPEKASELYKLQHAEKDTKNPSEETEKGSLVSVKI